MGSLVSVVSDPARRRVVLEDCVALLEAEVDAKSGLSGLAIKGAFKAVKGVRPGMIAQSMDALLDDFARATDPLWQECQAKGQEPRAFFVARKLDVANALLAITDGRAQRSPHQTLVKAYQGLRGVAVDHIGAAMPRLADLFAKHAR
jgi:hypothetical protein